MFQYITLYYNAKSNSDDYDEFNAIKYVCILSTLSIFYDRKYNPSPVLLSLILTSSILHHAVSYKKVFYSSNEMKSSCKPWYE